SLGLPPELPGMPAADLAARQAWWVASAIATAAGLGLIVFGRRPMLAIAGIGLIAAPHLWGAPMPESFESDVPDELHHRFVVAVTMTSLVFWLVLGMVSGLVRGRLLGSTAVSPETGIA